MFFAAILLTISFSLAGEFEPTLGDDGIYHYDWYHQSFLELEDDLEEALSAGKVLMVKFDQKGCIYCEKVALKILSEPAINRYVKEHFLVVQMDIFGSRDAIDLDGKELPENQMAARWGLFSHLQSILSRKIMVQKQYQTPRQRLCQGPL